VYQIFLIVLALPPLLYFVVGNYPATLGIQNLFSSSFVFSAMMALLVIGVITQVGRVITRVPALAQQIKTANAGGTTTTLFGICMGISSLGFSAISIAGFLGGHGPLEPAISSSHILQAITQAMGLTLVALALLALLLFPPSGGLVLAGAEGAMAAEGAAAAGGANILGSLAVTGWLIQMIAMMMGVPGSGGSGSSGSGGGGDPPPSSEEPQTFEGRVEKAVIDEMKDRPGGEYAETWELQNLDGPKAMSDNLDPQLGPDQVRYQATFKDGMTGKPVKISINYDPDTGQFGTIKLASGKP